jgi:hypothetical protein
VSNLHVFLASLRTAYTKAALASDASAALGARIAFDAADVRVDDRYSGPG